MNKLTLSDEEILALPAGKDLDKLVCEYVFGAVVREDGKSSIDPDGGEECWIEGEFSTDLNFAISVAERFSIDIFHAMPFSLAVRCGDGLLSVSLPSTRPTSMSMFQQLLSQMRHIN